MAWTAIPWDRVSRTYFASLYWRTCMAKNIVAACRLFMLHCL
jgi:hypothetical protein